MVRNSSPRMETTFYEDHSFNRGDVTQLKRAMTLDLNSPRNHLKRQKFNPVLSSPDLNMLKLGSPELESLIIQQQNGMVTTTPTPTQVLFPRTVTEEQEMYARGFVDALNELHHTSDSSQMSIGLQPVDVSTAPVTSNSSTVTYTTLEPQGPHSTVANIPVVSTVSAVPSVQSLAFPPITTTTCATVTSASSVYAQPLPAIKDEPQTVPNLGSSPPLSPINMECQERIKLERKRQRNRVAASKCRRRKLERIARLEDKVKLLKGENVELSSVVNKLKDQVCQLKEQVMDHVHSGCQIMVTAPF